MFDYERFSYLSICAICTLIILVGLSAHAKVQVQVTDNIELTTP